VPISRSTKVEHFGRSMNFSTEKLVELVLSEPVAIFKAAKVCLRGFLARTGRLFLGDEEMEVDGDAALSATALHSCLNRVWADAHWVRGLKPTRTGTETRQRRTTRKDGGFARI
jgi:hypothetical protein